MNDIKLIRTNPDLVKANIRKREMDLDAVVDEIIAIDAKRRELTGSTEAMKAEQNACTKKIPAMKKAGEDVAPVLAEMKALSEKIKAADAELGEIEAKQQELMLGLPNMPDEDVAAGGKEQNVPVHYFGEQPKFDFEPKNHVDLCESLGMIDYPRGAKVGGNGAWIYRGAGARLEWALLNFFVNEHLADGPVPEVCGGGLLDPEPDVRGQEIHAADGGDGAGEPAPRRDPHGGRAAEEVHCLHAVLPQRGGQLPLGGARHDPRPPVQQGGDGAVHDGGRLGRGV